MVNMIATGIILVIIVTFSFYLGILMGSDKQAAIDQKIVDQYDRMVNDRDVKIKRLELELKRYADEKE